jgi:hypothetical protein
MNRNLLTVAAAALITLTACGTEPAQNFGQGNGALVGAVPMVVYSPRGGQVDETGMMSLGVPENLGGVTLEGSVEIFARVDYAHNGVTGGVFKATPGKVQITFPFTEHATILQGEVTITDGTGKRHTYKPGESYLIRQGEVVLWEVRGQPVLKSFFNVVEVAPL